MSSVIVINSEGQNLGLMDYRDAVNLARGQDLDLVEVGRKEHLQVFKVMDRGKWLYEKKKAQKKNQQHTHDLKEVRFRSKIDKHDADIKIKHIKEFLEKGHHVQIVVSLKGRERQFIGLAENLVKDITAAIIDVAKVTPVKKSSGESNEVRMTMTATPSGNKPKNMEQESNG